MLTLRPYLDRWRRWRDSSANRSIFAGILTVGALTAAAKLVTIGKELLIAYRFGAADDLDAYLTALVLPQFAISVIAGAFQSAFVPTYVQVRQQRGSDAARAMFAASLRWGAILLIGVAALLLVTAPITLPLLGSGYSADKLRLTRTLFVVLIPVVVLAGLGQVLASVLNAGERFVPGALIPAVSPALIAVFLLVAGPRAGVGGIALAMLVGSGLEAGLLAAAHRRGSPPAAGRVSSSRAALAQLSRQYVPVALALTLLGSTALVDNAVAARLGSGSVSVLSYGTKLVSFILGIGTMALGTAVFPTLSKMAAARDPQGASHTLGRYTRLIVLASLPVMLVFSGLSTPIVTLIFERGEFTAQDTVLVSLTQALYALQIPFFLVAVLYARWVSAMQSNYLLLISTMMSVPLNLGLDILFSRWFGVAGIALATVWVYITSAFYLMVVSRLLMRKLI